MLPLQFSHLYKFWFAQYLQYNYTIFQLKFYRFNSFLLTCVNPLFSCNNFSIQLLTLSACSTSFRISIILEYRVFSSFLKVPISDFHLDIFKVLLSSKYSFRYFLALSNKIISAVCSVVQNCIGFFMF